MICITHEDGQRVASHLLQTRPCRAGFLTSKLVSSNKLLSSSKLLYSSSRKSRYPWYDGSMSTSCR